ncbi:helix-turn-helix domain-containing protein [Parasphingorhabdus sp. JC815]|uniref:helix-turn-helix domain-containing protein n=1 Tax=Parasphingorhabdus sp. JC815 TaxID=3232140 RepID=UPI00345AAAA8
MDEVRYEIAAIKSVLEQATEKMEALNGLFGSSDSEEPPAPLVSINNIDTTELVRRAEKLLKWSQFKTNMLNFGSGLFADSCWNMCLDTYICDLKGKEITVSSIAHGSGIPMTTAMRYINVMVEEGLLVKSPNPSDNRMIFLSTSAACKDKISTLLRHLD